MPKDTRLIVHSVRMPGLYDDKRRPLREPRTFGPGEEEELGAVLSSKQVERLLSEGVIKGDWDSQGASNEQPKPVPDDAAEVAASYISNTFGLERSSDETGAQFLESFVSSARALVADHKTELEEKQKQFSASFAQEEKARQAAEADVKRLKGELAEAKKAAKPAAGE